MKKTQSVKMLECKCKSTGHNIDTEQEATATNRNRKRTLNHWCRYVNLASETDITGKSKGLRWCQPCSAPGTPCCLKFCVRAPGRFTHTCIYIYICTHATCSPVHTNIYTQTYTHTTESLLPSPPHLLCISMVFALSCDQPSGPSPMHDTEPWTLALDSATML